MPNWVRNTLQIEADGPLTNGILEAIKDDKLGTGTIDFGKLIPMPKSLDIESGARSSRAIEIYREMKETGIGHLGDGRFYLLNPREDSYKKLAKFQDEYAAVIKADPGIIELGRLCHENKERNGHYTWYEWRTANWGTKWNACQQECFPYEEGSSRITFETAWNCVPGIVSKIAEMFPEARLVYRYASDDYGYCLGEITYEGGEAKETYIPDSANTEAFEFAAAVWGFPLKGLDAEYALSHDGSRYMYLDECDYDVIDILGTPALYSGTDIESDEYPEGLHKYIVGELHDMVGVFPEDHSPALIGYKGCVFTREALDIYRPHCVATEITDFPEVIKEGVSFKSFLNDAFTGQTNQTHPETEGGMKLA